MDQTEQLETAVAEALARCATSPLYDVLRGMGHGSCVLPTEIRALDPRWRLAGRISTFVGAMDASLDRHRSLLAWTQLLSRVPAGTIIVGQPNTREIALMGELSANALKQRGVLGYVVDGGCRDLDLILSIDFPVWCSFATPADIVGRWAPTELFGRIAIGEVQIDNGDYLLADRDGAVVIPQAIAAEAVAQTVRVMETEDEMRQAIMGGMDPEQAYLKYGKF